MSRAELQSAAAEIRSTLQSRFGIGPSEFERFMAQFAAYKSGDCPWKCTDHNKGAHPNSIGR